MNDEHTNKCQFKDCWICAVSKALKHLKDHGCLDVAKELEVAAIHNEANGMEAYSTIERLTAERDAAVEREGKAMDALTPSPETKAAYMGEFSVPFPEVDKNGDEYIRKINVPWVTIKEIMHKIKETTDAK